MSDIASDNTGSLATNVLSQLRRERRKAAAALAQIEEARAQMTDGRGSRRGKDLANTRHGAYSQAVRNAHFSGAMARQKASLYPEPKLMREHRSPVEPQHTHFSAAHDMLYDTMRYYISYYILKL